MKHLLSAVGTVGLMTLALVGDCVGQAANGNSGRDDAKPALKKPAPAAKPSAGATVSRARKDWGQVPLGGVKEPYAEITRAPTGKPILAIHYPWQVHLRPSVEIRFMADDEPDTGELRPLRFVAEIMKGEITSAVFDCRDKAAETPVSKALKAHGREFEVVGSRNLLAKPAATVVFPERARTEDVPDWAARAIFFLLDSWAVDPRTLWLELPAEHFSEPGRVRVWFYRDDRLLWWKTLAWPGLK